MYMFFMKRLTLCAAVVYVALMPLTSCGGPPGESHAAVTEVMVDERGHAIGGYDPVAYFVDGGPRRGREAITTVWGNAEWLFASIENRDRFIADPEQYAPVYGGWCAYGVAQGYAAETDPQRAWSVYEDRLYLNWDRSVAEQWSQNKDGYIKRSELNWPGLRSDLKTGKASVYRK